MLRMCLALALGALLPLAFAPFSVWPLAFVIPALLLAVIQGSLSARNIFFAGWLFGIGYFGFGVYWIYNSLHDFGMAPPLVAGGITGLLVVYLTWRLARPWYLSCGTMQDVIWEKPACGCYRCSGSASNGSRAGLSPACPG
jgi:apolipoprotein N-acyltransferase